HYSLARLLLLRPVLGPVLGPRVPALGRRPFLFARIGHLGLSLARALFLLVLARARLGVGARVLFHDGRRSRSRRAPVLRAPGGSREPSRDAPALSVRPGPRPARAAGCRSAGSAGTSS